MLRTLAAIVVLASAPLTGCSMWEDAYAPVQRTESMVQFHGVGGLADARIAVTAADDGSSAARDAFASTLAASGLDVADGGEGDLTIDVMVERLGEHSIRVLVSSDEASAFATRLVAAAHVDTDGMEDAGAVVLETTATLAADLVEAVRAQSASGA